MSNHSTTKRSKRIKDFPLSDRPREKLLTKGPENLTDVELLAIILRTGTKEYNVIKLSQKILRLFPLSQLSSASIDRLKKTPGIGEVKAIEICAVLELGKRIFGKTSLTKTIITSTHDALLQGKDISQKKQEYLITLYLNARHELLQKEVVGIGSLNAAIIEPKDILSHALLLPCAEIIIMHNHPSGDPQPSDADITFTKRMNEAGSIMGIALLDHIIIADTGYFSFADTPEYG